MFGVRYLGGGKVAVSEYPDPTPKDGEVLIRIEVAAICGSDLHALLSDNPLESNTGHEAVGIIVDASKSRLWKGGERVGIYAVWGCGKCSWCQRGIYTFCDRRKSCGGLQAQYACVPEHIPLPLPEDVDFVAGVLLSGDGFGTPYHACKRMKVNPKDFVSVVGCGPVGLGCVLYLSHIGARVIALDVRHERLDYARELGAEFVVNPMSVDAVSTVRDVTNGAMSNGVIEASGRPEGFALAMQLVGKGGTVVCVGENRDVTVNIGQLIRGDIAIFGSWYYHRGEYWEMVELYRRGLDVRKLISHEFALSEAQRAFDEFVSGTTAKVILKLWE
ncbi:MAG: zinc-binding dehydrogenase [Armatimonadota bacterium]|nr:zinc-binding dehydrogenase [Armatimonadota bacterium]MCX7776498.1 zinc-binding dehydrogenase [Armatimonadota bacterium]MDW8024295.1 zinc-binding dehydrogenase [Armatimonadota bacterium]